MKAFRSIWFALLVTACGDARVDTKTKPVVQAPIETAVAVDAPAIIETTKPAAKPPNGNVAEVIAMPEKYADRMAMGKALVGKGEHARARELFEAAAALEKKQAEPHVELARSYIATGDKGLAVKHATKAVKLAPKSSAAYNTLGRAELLRHGYDNAIAAFIEATELDGENAWAWNNLGYTYLQLKRYEEAALALAEATAKPAATGYMWNNLGLAYEQLDELDNARFAFAKGGKLGSKEAASSGRRLQGVDTIVQQTKPQPIEVGDQAQLETSYPASESDGSEADADEDDVEDDDEDDDEVEIAVEVEVQEVIIDGESKTLDQHVKDDVKSSVDPVPVTPPKSI